MGSVSRRFRRSMAAKQGRRWRVDPRVRHVRDALEKVNRKLNPDPKPPPPATERWHSRLARTIFQRGRRRS